MGICDMGMHLIVRSLASLVVGSVAGGVSLGLGKATPTLLLVAGHEELAEARDGQHLQRAVAGLHELCQPLH